MDVNNISIFPSRLPLLRPVLAIEVLLPGLLRFQPWMLDMLLSESLISFHFLNVHALVFWNNLVQGAHGDLLESSLHDVLQRLPELSRRVRFGELPTTRLLCVLRRHLNRLLRLRLGLVPLVVPSIERSLLCTAGQVRVWIEALVRRRRRDLL